MSPINNRQILRNIGVILIAVGLVWIVGAFNMNTTVETESRFIRSRYIPSTTVNNIGLMNDQRNHVAAAGLIILIGVVLLVSRKTNKTPAPDEHVPPQDHEFFSGERDIEIPKYQLYLVKKYSIEKNSTLEKYTIADLVFDSLRDALLHASETENHLISIRQEKLAKLNQVAPAFIDLLYERITRK